MISFEELKKAITETIDERIDKKLDEFSKELLSAFSHGDCEISNTAKEINEFLRNHLYIDGSHRMIHKPVKRMKKPNYADLNLK